MAIRPVDLQQTVMKSPDVTRDVAAQQQAASAHQAHTGEVTRRQAQKAETVQQFDEAGAVLIRDRQGRGGQAGEDSEAEKQQPEAEAEAEVDGLATSNMAPKPRLGRHIDLQA